LPKS
ncbi:ompA family protein, partial [Vibrio parahaemolyticus EKP-008]|jgi:hypothetical protein